MSTKPRSRLNARNSASTVKVAALFGKEINEKGLSDIPRVEHVVYEVKYVGALTKNNVKSIVKL